MKKTRWILTLCLGALHGTLHLFHSGRYLFIESAVKATVRVAAVQISGYDKGDWPPSGLDVVGRLLPYIDQAKQEHAELVVFPEYVLGHIDMPRSGDRSNVPRRRCP